MLSKEEIRELKELSKSSKLREDTKKLAENRYNPFIKNGKMDIDIFISFLTEFNQFINHTPRIFRRIINMDMRL